MHEMKSITTALCLTDADVKALTTGRMIAALSKTFIRAGQQFIIYPVGGKTDSLLPSQNRQLTLLSSIQTVTNQLSLETLSMTIWARCELCQILDEKAVLTNLAALTIWTEETLKEVQKKQKHLFLLHLRVYILLQPIEVSASLASAEKLGKFVGLPATYAVSDKEPALSDCIFTQRRHQLENLYPPLYPELERLQEKITQLAVNDAAAEKFGHFIRVFLGWSSSQTQSQISPDLAWIKTIADVGNSSEGYAFEKLVRRGLLQLGFRGDSLKPDSTGGAGGMDFYCEEPYPVVGECKATKTETVNDGTAAQLLKIGMNHLGKDQYERSIKLIVAAGELNFYALRTATENAMNVIRPETLQRLVEMQTIHKGSIDLIELQLSLQKAPFGLADQKIDSYLDTVGSKIKVRSQIIQAVKQLTEPNRKQLAVMEIRVQYNAKFVEELNDRLNDDQMVHELLIELSSPLTGYLGRIQGTSLQTDRFYFLRDLPVD